MTFNFLKRIAKMAEEIAPDAGPVIEPTALGKGDQKTKVYSAEVVDKLVNAEVKRESSSRDAAIRAALDKYTTSILEAKLAGLEFKLVDDTRSLKNGINYVKSLDSVAALSSVTNAKHGDMYIISGVGYIYTVEAKEVDGETVYDKYWAALPIGVDFSNYFTKSETWSKEAIDDLKKIVDRNNAMILAIVAQLRNLIELNKLGSSATNEQLASLQGSILDCLQACHARASRILDEELEEGEFEPEGE